MISMELKFIRVRLPQVIREIKATFFSFPMRPLPKLQNFHQKHIVCKTIHATRQSAKIATKNKWYRITDRFQSNLYLPLIKTEIKLYFIWFHFQLN